MATERTERRIVVRGTEIRIDDDRQRYRQRIARVTLDSMVQFVGLLDAKGTVLEINKVALDAVGISLSDVEGRPFWTTFWWQVSQEVNAGLRDAISRASRGEFVRWDAEIFGRAGGKETIIIDASLMPVMDDAGRVVFICAEGRDITEKKAHEREIARQREELAQLDKLKTQFFANISHEFRTPLTLMIGPLEDALAEADGLSAANQERLELTHRNSLRLLKLVNTLLDFSRIEAGRIRAQFEPTDLSALTTELASTFRSASERAGMQLVLDCPPLPEAVYVDHEMWEKIVLNLLSNAFKFTFAGRIEVSLRTIGPSVQLTVSDTGTGIPAEEIPRLFERFHRVKGARGRSYEGSGIGLALVQELVKLHGGTMQVESEEGRGSAFTATLLLGKSHLPADRSGTPPTMASTGLRSAAFVREASRWFCDDAPESVTRQPGPARDPVHDVTQGNGSRATGRPTGQRILVADDNADMREYVRRLLHDHEVQAVADGRDALRVAREWIPDLVLSDVMMPGLDGFGLLSELRADSRTCEVPVILLSARAGEEARIEGMEAGADDYIAKPFSGKELLARVQAHLQLAALRREGQAALRESEALNRVLIDLDAATQPLVDPAEIMAVSARLLAEHLGADRCAYAEVEDESIYVITGDHSVGVSSIVGRWPVVAFGTEHLRMMRSNEPYIVEDSHADPRITPADLPAYRAADIRAVICTPVHKDGKFSAAVAVHQKVPRRWAPFEVRLVTAIAGRCWEALERARVTRVLRESEARYRAIVEATPECVMLVASDGTLLQMNSAGLAIIEADEGALGKSVYSVVAPEFRDAFRAFNERICAGERGTLQFDLIGRKGTRRHLETTAVPLPATTGGFTQLAVARDVTARKQAEKELHDIRSRMEAALAAGAIGTWAWDIQEDRFHGDESLARIFSVPREVVAGGPIARLMDAIHPDDRDQVGRLVTRAVESGGRYEADYRVARADGSWRWVTARGQVELAENGRATRFPGVVIDVTERKRAEEALTRVTDESERRKRLYETILSNTPDLAYVFGLDHRFTYANETLLKMWGKSWDEAVGKNCLELGYEPWHAELHDREIEQVVKSREPIRGEVPFTGTFGRRIYEYIFVPVIGAAGEVEAVAGTTRDVTERKALEEELREADRRKDDFIALLAHELRNPLAPIRNGLQVMRLAGADASALDEARAMMDRQLAHMVRLIDDLLDISRINRNKMELKRAPVSLSDVVASAVETARPVIDEAGHELSVTLPGVPLYLDADLTRLAQVFSNLLSNSAKYTPPGGRIWLAVERREGRAVVSVRDTGIGIPPASLPAIFDMFSQVDRSMERTTGGLGIGLALVKGLVEMHGGSVTAASPGESKGSTFTVTLPVSAERSQADNALRDAAAAEPRPSSRILVVDDNRDGANSLAMMLRLMNNEVVTANDGVEALDVAERFRPEVILMDVGMPRLNGLDATREIRKRPWGTGITIIALTGWGQEGDRERSREAGCDGHLVKPVHLRDLEKMLLEARSH